MNLRILLGSAAVVALACSSQPPPIGTTDASTSDGSGGGDGAATKDGSSDAATTDADGGGGGDGGSCTLTSPPSSQACATCVESACCDAWNACAANADCAGYIACVRKCYPPDAGTVDAGAGDGGLPPIGDGGEGSGFACAKACDNTYPNGVNDGIVVVDCEDTSCTGLCD